MIRKELLWQQEKTKPLIFMIPGATGTQKEKFPGYPSMAGFFWLHGFSSYIASTSGQDSLKGYYTLQRCYDECATTLSELNDLLTPRKIVIFGRCSGGTVATHLAAHFDPSLLILYESWPEYPVADRQAIATKMEGRVNHAPNYLDEFIETKDAASSVTCPVLLLHGDIDNESLFTISQQQTLSNLFSNTSSKSTIHIKGADHSLPRGTNANLLRQTLERLLPLLEISQDKETLYE